MLLITGLPDRLQLSRKITRHDKILNDQGRDGNWINVIPVSVVYQTLIAIGTSPPSLLSNMAFQAHLVMNRFHKIWAMVTTAEINKWT